MYMSNKTSFQLIQKMFEMLLFTKNIFLSGPNPTCQYSLQLSSDELTTMGTVSPSKHLYFVDIVVVTQINPEPGGSLSVRGSEIIKQTVDSLRSYMGRIFRTYSHPFIVSHVVEIRRMTLGTLDLPKTS